MQLLVYIVFGVMMSGLGYHLYGAEIERREALADMAKAAAELKVLESEQHKLKDDIEYFSNPHNLEKELRARFNYRAPNEKLIIVVPPKEKKAGDSD